MSQQVALQIGTKTGASWNPWMFCHKISVGKSDGGCLHCYMFREVLSKRIQKRHPDWKPDHPQLTKTTQNAPKHMKGRQMVFACSWSDFFIREADAPGWRDHAWKVIRETPQHVYRICTKRPERIRPLNGPSLLPDDWDSEWNHDFKNVWLGVTVEHQNWARRMDYLRNIPCTLRWVSAEPLLGPLALNLTGFSFLVDGGESGGKDEKIRPANLDWFRSLRDQCQAAGIPYCHKQHGGLKKCSKAMHKQLFGDQPFPPHEKAWGCRVLDGRLHDDFPTFPPYP